MFGFVSGLGCVLSLCLLVRYVDVWDFGYCLFIMMLFGFGLYGYDLEGCCDLVLCFIWCVGDCGVDFDLGY